jgi:hypothetical protein
LTGARLAGAFRGDGSVLRPRVRYDRDTRWPAGFDVDSLAAFMSNADTPLVRFQKPADGGRGFISCGSQCFQGTAIGRLASPFQGSLVRPPRAGSSCRTRIWRGQWRLIGRADRSGRVGGLFVCRR